MMQKQEKLASLPGVWATLAAGFELTTRHWWLLLIPVLLDLFLWLGPRLSLQPLIEQLLVQWPTEVILIDPRPILELLAPRTNMFTYLSVTFIGAPALMNGLVPEQTPLASAVIEIATVEWWLGLALLFTVVGLFLAAIFYSLVGRAVVGDTAMKGDTTMDGDSNPHPARHKEQQAQQDQWLSRLSLLQLIPRTWLRFFALAALFLLLFAAIILPVSFMVALVGLVSQQMAVILALSTPVLFFWALIFLSFTPQGLVLTRRPFLKNVWESVRLLQINLIQAISLLVIVALVNWVLKQLLLAADNGSWLTLVSILGHAFITTALLAATFIFYRDRYTILFADEPLAEASSSEKAAKRQPMNVN